MGGLKCFNIVPDLFTEKGGATMLSISLCQSTFIPVRPLNLSNAKIKYQRDKPAELHAANTAPPQSAGRGRPAEKREALPVPCPQQPGRDPAGHTRRSADLHQPRYAQNDRC